MKYINDKLQKALAAIRENTTEEAVEIVANLFLEIEMEMDFMDRKRTEAEDAFAYWVENLRKQKEEKEKKVQQDENFVSSGE